MIRSLPILRVLCFLLTFMTISSNTLAGDTYSKNLSCYKNGIDPNSQKCIEFLRRSQLKTIKLSPHIRIKKIKRDSDFNLTVLRPFIVGSGLFD